MGGYGDGFYSPPVPATSVYGRPPPIITSVAVTKVPDAYTLDNFGGILYAMTSADGRLLMWDPERRRTKAGCSRSMLGRGPVPNGRCFVVTPERFIMIFGSYNDGTVDGRRQRAPLRLVRSGEPRRLGLYQCLSQAGFLDIEPASPIVVADSTRSRRDLLDRQEDRTTSASSECPTSITTWSSPTGQRRGLRSRCRRPRR